MPSSIPVSVLQASPIGVEEADVTRSPSLGARLQVVLKRLFRSNTFRVGFAILLFWVVAAIFWPWISPDDPFRTVVSQTFKSPSLNHWFGTDWLGRDVFSRVLAGATSILTVAPAAALVCVSGGTIVGLIAGYKGGWVDEILMRLMDALLAFPAIIKAILVLAVLGGSRASMILVIGFVYIPAVSRVIRGAVLAERVNEYVAAAQLRGESSLYVMFAEILPNVTGPIAVETSIRLGYAIFASATLSFLSFGVPDPSPDWGLTVSLGSIYLQTAPWIVLFPAAALGTLVIAIYLLAEDIRRLIDGDNF